MAGSAADSRSVAERLLAILDAFDRPGPLTLTEIADQAGLPLPTAHRLAGRLVAWGGLERSGAEYRIGLKLWRLGTRHPAPGMLRQAALPYLEDLFDLTRQNVQIAVRDGLAALYLEQLAARESVSVVADVGRQLPLHATGVGQVLLAHADEDLLASVLAAAPRKYLPATLTTESELRRRLAEVRTTGLALTRDEMTAGSASIAAPVRDATGKVIAALSIIAPSATPVDPRYGLAVRIAANGISRDLGWHRRPATSTE